MRSIPGLGLFGFSGLIKFGSKIAGSVDALGSLLSTTLRGSCSRSSGFHALCLCNIHGLVALAGMTDLPASTWSSGTSELEFDITTSAGSVGPAPDHFGCFVKFFVSFEDEFAGSHASLL